MRRCQNRPLATEFEEHLAKPGQEGGMQAHEVSFREEEGESIEEQTSLGWRWAQVDKIVEEKAADLLQGIRMSVRKCKRRKAVPPYSAPAEVWLFCLWPNWRERPTAPKEGIGFAETVDKIRCPEFFCCFPGISMCDTSNEHGPHDI